MSKKLLSSCLAALAMMLSFTSIAKAEYIQEVNGSSTTQVPETPQPSPESIPQTSPESTPQPSCTTQAGYPLGRWKTRVKSDTPTSKFSTFIIFTRPKGGTWLPSYSGQGNFSASSSPAPGAQVILKLRVDGNDSYVSKNKLVVSPDGCRMKGTFLDTEGYRGEVRYQWQGG